MWWLYHLWVIAFQIAAFICYAIGSYRFYQNKKKFMRFLTWGIVLDIIMALGASSGILPRMQVEQSAPWSSPLFIVHVALAGFGLIGFILMYLYLLIRGTDYEYRRLRKFQFKILLPCWLVGITISLINFFVKVLFQIRLYDFI